MMSWINCACRPLRNYSVEEGILLSWPVLAVSTVWVILLIMKMASSVSRRANKYQGSFAVKVTIDVDGLAKDPEIVRGLGFGLDEQAILAIARWRFKPGEKDGVPVPVRATIEVNFKLL